MRFLSFLLICLLAVATGNAADVGIFNEPSTHGSGSSGGGGTSGTLSGTAGQVGVFTGTSTIQSYSGLAFDSASQLLTTGTVSASQFTITSSSAQLGTIRRTGSVNAAVAWTGNTTTFYIGTCGTSPASGFCISDNINLVQNAYLRVTTGQDVGIGWETKSPTARLDVNGIVSGTSMLPASSYVSASACTAGEIRNAPTYNSVARCEGGGGWRVIASTSIIVSNSGL